MSYPGQLQKMYTNDGHKVLNFGVNGATASTLGDKPYTTLDAYKEALACKPDIYIFNLGCNDSKTYNWNES